MGIEINGLDSCSLEDAIACVPYVWKIGKAPMLWGPPGIGKTAVIYSLAKSMTYTIPDNPEISSTSVRLAAVYGKEFTGRRVHPVRLIICSPTDMKGIPVFDTESKEAIWVMTGLFPVSESRLRELEDRYLELRDSGKPTASIERAIEAALHDQHSILFMDEITQAPQTVQHAALQIILDKSSGTYSLPDGVDVICAGNRAGDRAGSHAMSSVLASRVVHFNVDAPVFSEFKNYMVSSDWDRRVMAYLETHHVSSFYTFDPSTFNGSTFACPRTWDMVQEFLKVCDGNMDVVKTTIPGMIGSVANDFLGWLEYVGTLPSAAKYLDGSIDLDDVVPFFYTMDPNLSTMKYRIDVEFMFTLECINILSSGSIYQGQVDRFFDLLLRSKDTIDLSISSVHRLFSELDQSSKVKVIKSPKWKDVAKHLNEDKVFTGK